LNLANEPAMIIISGSIIILAGIVMRTEIQIFKMANR